MIIRVGNTDYTLSFSFVALIVFMVLIKEDRIVLLSLLSSFVHEAGHFIFMKINKAYIDEVKFGLFGMRIERIKAGALSFYKEMMIAAGGIIFNLLFSLICYIIYEINRNSNLLILSAVNIIIAAVNSIPVGILDSGRIIYCILMIYYDESEAEKIIDCISFIFTVLFSLFTLIYCLSSGINLSLLIINLYLFTVIVFKKWS